MVTAEWKEAQRSVRQRRAGTERPAGQDKVFRSYFECVGKSQEGFSKRMTWSDLPLLKIILAKMWGTYNKRQELRKKISTSKNRHAA